MPLAGSWRASPRPGSDLGRPVDLDISRRGETDGGGEAQAELMRQQFLDDMPCYSPQASPTAPRHISMRKHTHTHLMHIGSKHTHTHTIDQGPTQVSSLACPSCANTSMSMCLHVLASIHDSDAPRPPTARLPTIRALSATCRSPLSQRFAGKLWKPTTTYTRCL